MPHELQHRSLTNQSSIKLTRWIDRYAWRMSRLAGLAHASLILSHHSELIGVAFVQSGHGELGIRDEVFLGGGPVEGKVLAYFHDVSLYGFAAVVFWLGPGQGHAGLLDVVYFWFAWR